MAMGPELSAALEHAYEVFAASPPPRHADVCSHCWGDASAEAILATAPRDLTPSDVRNLAGALGLTFGGPRETRWFAPRLVASLVDRETPGMCMLVSGALRRAGWPDWPHDEVEALRAVMSAAANETLRTQTDGDHVAAVLESIACMDADFDPYLARWAALPARERSLALLRVLPAIGALVGAPGLPEASTGEWHRAPGAFESLRRFVCDSARLLEACEYVDDPALAGQAAAARLWIDHLAG